MRQALRAAMMCMLLTAVAGAWAPASAQEAASLPRTGLPRVVLPADTSFTSHADGSDQGQPRRQTRRGARIGAVVGTITGLGIGSLMALWCRGWAPTPVTRQYRW